MPLLMEENAWLKEYFGEGIYDNEITFSDAPVKIDDEIRKALITFCEIAEQPYKEILEQYLAEH